jgi:hypothetical protein
MGSPLFKNDLRTDHEPGIPRGETPPLRQARRPPLRTTGSRETPLRGPTPCSGTESRWDSRKKTAGTRLGRNQGRVVAEQVLLKVRLRRQGGLIAVALGLVALVVNQGFAHQGDSDVQVTDLPNLALLERNQCFGGGWRRRRILHGDENAGFVPTKQAPERNGTRVRKFQDRESGGECPEGVRTRRAAGGFPAPAPGMFQDVRSGYTQGAR